MHMLARWTTYAVAIVGVLGAGWLATRRHKSGGNDKLITE
jgi:hypothetical protein